MAKALASKLGYIYIDTGAMYRAVTLYCLENSIINNGKPDKDALGARLPKIDISFRFDNEQKKSETLLNGRNIEKEIREMRVSEHVSTVSSIKEVRQKLVELQQSMGKNKGVVMDGRDIGTVVLPDAELKIFMTADNTVRTKRRYDELVALNPAITIEEVRKNIESRDYEDIHRKESPLIQVADAIVLDNTYLTYEQQLEVAYRLSLEKLRKM